MSERRISRRSFLTGLFGIGFKYGFEPPVVKNYKILETEVDYGRVSEAERHHLSELASLREDQVPYWYPEIRPHFISIPKLSISDVIKIGTIVRTGPDKVTYETPDEGIATPEHSQYPLVLAYAHSRLNKVKQKFADIVNLDVGDLVFVSQPTLEGKFEAIYGFAVFGMRLSNEPLIKPDSLTLTLQTSAIYNGEWLIDENTVMGKADSSIADFEESRYFVDAKPVRIRVPL